MLPSCPALSGTVPVRIPAASVAGACRVDRLQRPAQAQVRPAAGGPCIITSPPYLDVTSFEEDQWLRLWFLGGPPHPTRNRVSRDDRHELASAYWRMVADCWRTAGYLVASRGHVVVRMAGKGLSADAVVDGLTGCAVVAGRDVSLVDWERARSPGDRPTPSDPDR